MSEWVNVKDGYPYVSGIYLCCFIVDSNKTKKIEDKRISKSDVESKNIHIGNGIRLTHWMKKEDKKTADSNGGKHSMKIRKMIDILGGDRNKIAERAGISLAQLNNSVSRDGDVEELIDGRFVTVRSNATYFEREDEAN